METARQRLKLLLTACVVLTACDRDEATATKPQTPAVTPSADPVADPGSQPTSATPTGALALLEWLDPDAVAIVYSKLGKTVDPVAFSTVFAVPPKLSRMLRDVPAIDDGLDAIRDPSDPHPDAWLAPLALASTPRVSSGTYVLRELTKPRADVIAILERAKFRATEAEGFTMLEPQGPFQWRVVFLTDTVVAFVPIKGIGTGLSPLTAGRDLPPSDVENELRTMLEQEPSTTIEAYASGPLLHLDLGQDVAQFAVRARPFNGKGIDAEVRLVPVEDVSAAAAALEGRDLSLETDALAAVAKKVAFTIEGPSVVGRLQATPADVATLAEG